MFKTESQKARIYVDKAKVSLSKAMNNRILEIENLNTQRDLIMEQVCLNEQLLDIDIELAKQLGVK